MASTLTLFQGFRIIQIRMMVLSVIHVRPNQKLKAILEGCANLTHLWGSTLTAHNLFAQPFFQFQTVYLPFTHIMKCKFYIGSAMHHTLDPEYSRSRKFFQLTNDRLVQAELALRYSVTCPDHFATGDVYTLLSILRSAPADGNLILTSQDLAGFFTSIDQARFIGAIRGLVHAPGLLATPQHINVDDNEVFSVYPGKSNNPGDPIKGRTFRRLNATRKIVIKDVPSLLTTALDMQTFALGQRCIRQRRGSPMGSPLSPALCLMVVSISEQIWSINFKQALSSHHLFIKHIRYVDNRPIFGDIRLQDLPPYEVLLDEGFYGKPIILETEPDEEFLGFMLETQPLELIDLQWTHQHVPGPLTLLGLTTQSPSQWLSVPMPHRCQRCISGSPHPSRLRPIDPALHHGWLFQRRTTPNFFADPGPSAV